MIVKTPGTCGGEARVKGHRIAVWMIEESRRCGLDEQQLYERWSTLSPVEIMEALRYAANNVGEINEAIRRNDECC